MRARSSATALLVITVLLSLASRPVAAPSQDQAAAPAINVEALKLEHRLALKTVEASTLKVELYRSQLSLVSVLLQQAQAEAAESDRQRQARAGSGTAPP